MGFICSLSNLEHNHPLKRDAERTAHTLVNWSGILYRSIRWAHLHQAPFCRTSDYTYILNIHYLSGRYGGILRILNKVELIENINRNNRKLLDPESSVTSQEAISKSLLFRPGISPEASKAAGEERKAGTAMGGTHASSTPPTSLPPPLLPDS